MYTFLSFTTSVCRPYPILRYQYVGLIQFHKISEQALPSFTISVCRPYPVLQNQCVGLIQCENTEYTVCLIRLYNLSVEALSSFTKFSMHTSLIFKIFKIWNSPVLVSELQTHFYKAIAPHAISPSKSKRWCGAYAKQNRRFCVFGCCMNLKKRGWGTPNKHTRKTRL